MEEFKTDPDSNPDWTWLKISECVGLDTASSAPLMRLSLPNVSCLPESMMKIHLLFKFLKNWRKPRLSSFILLYRRTKVRHKLEPSINLSTNDSTALRFNCKAVLSTVKRLAEGHNFCNTGVRPCNRNKLDGLGSRM